MSEETTRPDMATLRMYVVKNLDKSMANRYKRLTP